ncbi:MAG: alpha/beta hydrolase [Gammaproteobacteria bacterium]
MRARRMLRRLIAPGLLVGLVGLLGIAWVGDTLTRPAPRVLGDPPPSLAATSVRLAFGRADVLAGWFARGTRGAGAVLLLHGIRANRLQMLARAEALHADGYSVLLVDLPAHGESSGDRITFGAREAAGVRAALRYLRTALPGERIGVIGVSLGAAALVLAQPTPAPAAVVLESMYSTVEVATANRLQIRFGRLGTLLEPLFTAQIPWRLGIAAETLRPLDALGVLKSPVLIASGTEDAHTRWSETRRLYAAARPPKALWRVEGARHQDLRAYAPAEYASVVFGFLAEHLR